MYLKAQIAIDPSTLTEIVKVKPKKVFKKMLYMMSAGGISEKEEVETFTALTCPSGKRAGNPIAPFIFLRSTKYFRKNKNGFKQELSI